MPSDGGPSLRGVEEEVAQRSGKREAYELLMIEEADAHLLIVIREAGAWAMVAHLGGEGSTTGWVRRGDLAIR